MGIKKVAALPSDNKGLYILHENSAAWRSTSKSEDHQTFLETLEIFPVIVPGWEGRISASRKGFRHVGISI